MKAVEKHLFIHLYIYAVSTVRVWLQSIHISAVNSIYLPFHALVVEPGQVKLEFASKVAHGKEGCLHDRGDTRLASRTVPTTLATKPRE